MGLPVKTVASGGLPVVETTSGSPVTEVTGNFGVPVTKIVGKPYGLPVVFVNEMNGPVTPANVTFESATASAVTLSGGNLIATNTGTTSNNQGAHVAAASGKTSGKYYFEFRITTFTGGAGVGVGIATPASTYTGLSGSPSLTGVMCYAVGHTGSGTIMEFTSGNTGLSVGACASGDVIGVAVDFTSTNRRVWFRKGAAGLWNGQLAGVADPTLGNGLGGGVVMPAGAIVPFITFGNGPAGQNGVAGNVITANFGGSAFVGAVLSGYTSGWPA